jgi:hypothetical protein
LPATSSMSNGRVQTTLVRRKDATPGSALTGRQAALRAEVAVSRRRANPPSHSIEKRRALMSAPLGLNAAAGQRGCQHIDWSRRRVRNREERDVTYGSASRDARLCAQCHRRLGILTRKPRFDTLGATRVLRIAGLVVVVVPYVGIKSM